MSRIVRKSAAIYVQEPVRACGCPLIYLHIYARISRSLQGTLRFLGAKNKGKGFL
jgi:hypothetical protein